MKTEPSALSTRFIAAMNAQDSAAYLALFHSEAYVHDEGHGHRGTEQIRGWIEKAWACYQPQLVLQEVLSTGENTAFLGEVSGTFPGSPIVLKHELEVKDHLITELKIAP